MGLAVTASHLLFPFRGLAGLEKRLPKIYVVMFPWVVSLIVHAMLLTVPLRRQEQSATNTAGKVRIVDTSAAPATGEGPQAQPKAPQSSSSLVIPAARPAPQPSPVRLQPSPTPQSSSPQTKSPVPIRTSKASQPQAPKPKPPSKPETPIAANDLVVNLAQLPNTQPCQQLEGCWRSQNSLWQAVYKQVAEQITTQGYKVIELDLEDDTGFKVSQIAKNGTTKYYLHMLSTLEGTVYVLNPTQLSKDEIEQRINST